MTVRETSAPPYEPVSLAQARAWCRVTLTNEDDILTMLIAAMRRQAENLTGRAFVQRELELVLPAWPWCTIVVEGMEYVGIELPSPPLIAVSSVSYVNTDGDVTVLAADQYTAHTWREPGFITPAWQVAWPAARSVPDAIRIAYSAGYAPLGSPVDEAAYQAVMPANLGLWMRARAATLFNNREQLISANTMQIPHSFMDGILDDLVVGTRIAG